MSKDLYIPQTPTFRVKVVFLSPFSVPPAVPEFTTSQLPNTQLLDGRNSSHLPINQEKQSHGESERRGQALSSLIRHPFWSSM